MHALSLAQASLSFEILLPLSWAIEKDLFPHLFPQSLQVPQNHPYERQSFVLRRGHGSVICKNGIWKLTA